jgi:IclR family acetate operon transcriptional repressor
VEQQFQGAQTIDRAAGLLVAVMDDESPVGTSELAARTGLPKSTASRLLGALAHHGLVQQDGGRGRFRPGPVLLRYAQRALVERHLAELAMPALEALAEVSGETINLAVPGPHGVEHLAQVDSRHFVGAGHWVGRQVPYHCTAVGKVLVAFGAAVLPGDAPLERLTAGTVTNREALDRELDTVRRDGLATATDELEVGLAAIAAPVLAGGGCLGALSISGPSQRLTPERIAELGPALLEQSTALGDQLGHQHEGAHAA